jgi:hypothetical protein
VALDFAIAHGFPHGGWCQKGRKAEDGAIDARYQLQQTPSDNYVQRTEWNVRDSDGTVVFSIVAALTGGRLVITERGFVAAGICYSLTLHPSTLQETEMRAVRKCQR